MKHRTTFIVRVDDADNNATGSRQIQFQAGTKREENYVHEKRYDPERESVKVRYHLVPCARSVANILAFR